MPTTKRQEELVPNVSYAEARQRFGGTREWRLFARNLAMHPFLREVLAQRQSGRCVWCRQRILDIGHAHIHHVSYEHVCGFLCETRIVTPRGRSRTVPDCASCMKAEPNLFLGCLERVRLVHKRCNVAIAFQSPWAPGKKQ